MGPKPDRAIDFLPPFSERERREAEFMQAVERFGGMKAVRRAIWPAPPADEPRPTA